MPDPPALARFDAERCVFHALTNAKEVLEDVIAWAYPEPPQRDE